jgi:hypothetical protein
MPWAETERSTVDVRGRAAGVFPKLTTGLLFSPFDE